MISVDNDMWTHITDTTLHLVSLLKSDPSALFCWWPTSSINQRKQANKLHRISMYSSKTQWLLWCSLCSDALMLPHISHLLLAACPDNSADCKQTIEYQRSKLCYEYSGEVLTHLDGQNPWLTWTKWLWVHFLVCPFCVEIPPLSCWDNGFSTLHYHPVYPLNAFFHFVISWE